MTANRDPSHAPSAKPMHMWAGDAAGITLGPRPAGWSKIRHQSSKLLAKNPNAYFYRHTEPGVVRVLSVTFVVMRRCAWSAFSIRAWSQS